MKQSARGRRFASLLWLVLAVACLCSAATLGCTIGQKEAATNTALDVMSKEERHEAFEAMARVLDEQPVSIAVVKAIASPYTTASASSGADATRRATTAGTTPSSRSSRWVRAGTTTTITT